MSRRPKVAVVGAGSAFFGPQVVSGLLGDPRLGDAILHLHDVNRTAAARMGRFAGRIVGRDEGRQTIEAGDDLAAALRGADVVIVSVAVEREATWARDRAVAQRFGIEHYAENGGPGAIFHAARNLSLVLPVAWEMERRCPDAWLLNYTNPVPRLCRAVSLYSDVRVAGVCHQLRFGYFVAGCLLSRELGIAVPGAPRFRWTDESVAFEARVAAEAQARIVMRAAGLNHFTWALAVEDRETGADLYPVLRERNRDFEPGFEPLTRQVFDLFDYFPVPGDSHLVEYLPYTHEAGRGTWDRFDIQMYDFAWSERQRRERAAAVARIADGQDPPDALALDSERAEGLVAALLGRGDLRDEALNLPNEGAITNLPRGVVVETPAQISAGTARAEAIGVLPEAVADLCRRQVTITDLAVRGIVEGERGLLRQALALDPMVTDPGVVDPMLEAYLERWELAAIRRP